MAQKHSQSPGDPRGRALRQRRAQMVKDIQEEEHIKRVIKRKLEGNPESTAHTLKTAVIVLTAIVCTIGAFIHGTNPKFFKQFSKKSIPTFQLATRYPADVVLQRDLPTFFRQYTIATPENFKARQAVIRMLKSREQLRRRAGRIKTTLKAWDNSNVDRLLDQGICGDEFEKAYHKASQPRKDDLLMWCLLASRVSEGFFKESLEMIDSPLFLTRKRGIVIKRQPPAGVSDGYGALSTSFYLHPRKVGDSEIHRIPTKMLSMLVSAPEQVLDGDAQDVIERMLYDQIVTQGNEDDFLILEEVCQETRPERAIGFESANSDNGCFVVVPKKYGGNFEPDDEDDEDD